MIQVSLPPYLTVANALQYECTSVITEDYPPGEDVIFRAGDRIVAVSVHLLPITV